MQVIHTKSEMRGYSHAVRGAGERLALVPTMGYLHAGHMSLVRLARARADRMVLSIFINPLQFGAGEDLERYPRDLERDLELARSSGVDAVFAPDTAEMYPDGEPHVVVVAEKGADLLCGASRPGHFRGVLTVIAKLVGIVTPDLAVFGQKDYQQLTLIRRMMGDLEMNIEIVGAPVEREADGLAMSSRNVHLSEEERSRALALSRGLAACRALFANGERDSHRFRVVLETVGGSGVDLEYAQIVDPDTLECVDRVESGFVCAIAARVGSTRLIDNVVLGS
ncbi:pantoate--beta-alanine ligase [soil metagenome]